MKEVSDTMVCARSGIDGGLKMSSFEVTLESNPLVIFESKTEFVRGTENGVTTVKVPVPELSDTWPLRAVRFELKYPRED
jgi:hypothetical protein